ncbi:transposable element Tcb2 transposase [Trichonephila clavipes]|nr:transposable element Tcb2 transposase [Trichonephila clavipes]
MGSILYDTKIGLFSETQRQKLILIFVVENQQYLSKTFSLTQVVLSQSKLEQNKMGVKQRKDEDISLHQKERDCRDEIHRPIVVPYAAAIGDDLILMDENCRPPRAILVEDFFLEEGIDALGRRVAGRQPPPQTLQELERALLEEWDRIPQLVINSHIDSMPQRCSTLLDVRGNHPPTENDFL